MIGGEQKRVIRTVAKRALHHLPLSVAERLKSAPRGSLPWRAGRLALFDRVLRLPHGLAAGRKLYANEASMQYFDDDIEQPVQEVMQSHLSRGDVFFDIGANIGFFTLIGATLVGPKGFVAAFEPEPENARAARRNLDLNGFTNYQLFQAAVAEREGRARLWLAEHAGGHMLDSAGRPPDLRDSMEVEVVAIDPLVAARTIPAPTLVKIDVEGAELPVLTGMQQTLERAQPTIICELDDASESELERKCGRIEAFLSERGYTIRRIPLAYAAMDWHVAHLLARYRSTAS